jgi:hypothetical protein
VVVGWAWWWYLSYLFAFNGKFQMFEIATEKIKSICNAAFPNEFVKNLYGY